MARDIFNYYPRRFRKWDDDSFRSVWTEAAGNPSDIDPLTPGLPAAQILSHSFELTATFVSRSAEQTAAVGQDFSRKLRALSGEATISVIGMVDTGKTALAKGLYHSLADTIVMQGPAYYLRRNKDQMPFRVLFDQESGRCVRHGDAAGLAVGDLRFPPLRGNPASIVNIIEHPTSLQLLKSAAAFVIDRPGGADAESERGIQLWLNRKNRHYKALAEDPPAPGRK